MTLSLKMLEQVRTVSESGSFSAAARRLGLSQPAISQQIRNIETTYSVLLFTRTAGRLTATPVCERLCDAADRVLHEHQLAETMLRHHGSLTHGQLSIGLGNAMPGMAVIATFNKAYPNIALRVETGSHEKIVRQVLRHEVDVGILPEITKDARFRCEPLLTNEVRAIVGLDHRLAQRTKLRCEDLLAEQLIFRTHGSSTQRVLDRYFKRHEVDPTPFLVLDSREAVYEAVVNGMGVGFVWKTGTGRNTDVCQLSLDSPETQSAEAAFAPVDREMETLNAFFNNLAEWQKSESFTDLTR